MQINQNTRMVGLVGTGERDLWSRIPVPTASDLDLAAPEVELRAANVLCIVQRNLLNAQEVVTVWHGGGDVDEEFGLACVRV